jgi:carbon storage regulator
MLVLSRKPGERVVVPDLGLVFTILSINGKRVRIGIAAPQDVKVDREEVWQQHQQETHKPPPEGQETPQLHGKTNSHVTVGDRDNRLESLAAELTSAIYPLLLRRGRRDSWLNMQLNLWRALETTVKKWALKLPPDSPARVSDPTQKSFLADLTGSALSVALANGFEGSALELESMLARTLRLACNVDAAPGPGSKSA